jgi:hypothetical protein
MKRTILTGSLLLSLLAPPVSKAAAPGCTSTPRFDVTCNRGSGLLAFNVVNCRRIGNVVIEVRDAAGRTVYREEGKAMTAELVRRLDRGSFPKGELTLSVTAKDFAVSQRIVNE